MEKKIVISAKTLTCGRTRHLPGPMSSTGDPVRASPAGRGPGCNTIKRLSCTPASGQLGPSHEVPKRRSGDKALMGGCKTLSLQEGLVPATILLLWTSLPVSSTPAPVFGRPSFDPLLLS